MPRCWPPASSAPAIRSSIRRWRSFAPPRPIPYWITRTPVRLEETTMKIGIIGAGQLGRMLALTGTPLGQDFVLLDPATDARAAALGAHLCAGYDHREQLRRLAEDLDVVTFEFENVPAETVDFLAQHDRVYPRAEAPRIALDSWDEKSKFVEMVIPPPCFAGVVFQDGLESALQLVGQPAVLTTRTVSYHGTGQQGLQQHQDVVD